MIGFLLLEINFSLLSFAPSSEVAIYVRNGENICSYFNCLEWMKSFSSYAINLFIWLSWLTIVWFIHFFFTGKEIQTEMERSTLKNFSMGCLIWWETMTKKIIMTHILIIQWMLQPECCLLSLIRMGTGIHLSIAILSLLSLNRYGSLLIVYYLFILGYHLNLCRYLSDIELLPIIGKLHPSEHYYAKQQADYIISQVLYLILQ